MVDDKLWIDILYYCRDLGMSEEKILFFEQHQINVSNIIEDRLKYEPKDSDIVSSITAKVLNYFFKHKRYFEDAKIDYIFTFVNELMLKEEFETIDSLLMAAEAESNTLYRISWLTITAPIKEKLKNRASFYQSTYDLLEQYPKRDKLLEGLE